MNRTDVYFSLPTWLQNVLISAYGYHLKRVRYGRAQQRIVRELLASQWLAETELRQLQLAKLSWLVQYARKTVPLYSARAMPDQIGDLGDVQQIPVLQKKDLQGDRGYLVSSAFRGKFEEVHTGGTTGTPLTIYCSRAVLKRNYAFFARFREWAGVPLGSRTATFAGRTIVPPDQQEPPFWRWNLASNTLLLSSYHISRATVPAYVGALEKFGPDVIDSYPSALEPIARYMIESGRQGVRPGAIITSSETLMPDVRALFEEAFQCKVFDHYGAAEMAALITQCEAGSYHVNPEFGYLEILKDGETARPGEVGEIVATGFVNPVMPLIRYATGDLASWREGDCECGRHFPMVEKLMGRMDDVITTPDGRLIGRLDPIFKAVSTIQEAQIIQDRKDRVRVQLVATDLPAQEAERLRQELQNRLGPEMTVDISCVNAIPRTERGKLRTVVNLVGRSTPAVHGAAGLAEK